MVICVATSKFFSESHHIQIMAVFSSKFWLIAEIISYPIYFIIITSAIYSNIRLCRHNDEMFIKKRNKKVLYGTNISIISMIVSSLIVQTLCVRAPVSLHIGEIFWFSSLWLIIYFFMVKNWIVYYKYHWTYHTMDTQWQNIINQNITSAKIQENWFIGNNKKYGNIKFVSKFFGKICLICYTISVLSVVAAIIDNKVHNRGPDFQALSAIIAVIIILLTPSIAISFYTIIVYKTPPIEDIFHIHIEGMFKHKNKQKNRM